MCYRVTAQSSDRTLPKDAELPHGSRACKKIICTDWLTHRQFFSGKDNIFASSDWLHI
jgi:hypothetical protein